MRLPDFVVIGAMKAGTTSLYHYLSQHPDVFMPDSKEVDFFYDRATWERGREWYASLFGGAGDRAMAGEASPNYTKTHVEPAIPARMASTIPDARLIYCLRDPIERIVSHHIHTEAERRESRGRRLRDRLRRRSGPEAVPVDALANDHYVLTSSYAFQVERFLEHYPREQLLLITTEQLRSEPGTTVASVYRFIGADPDFVPDTTTQHHRSGDKFPGADQVRPTDEAIEVLRERLAPDVRRLRRHLGPDFDGWGIA